MKASTECAFVDQIKSIIIIITHLHHAALYTALCTAVGPRHVVVLSATENSVELAVGLIPEDEAHIVASAFRVNVESAAVIHRAVTDGPDNGEWSVLSQVCGEAMRS